jgi:hypothetical protein
MALTAPTAFAGETETKARHHSHGHHHASRNSGDDHSRRDNAGAAAAQSGLSGNFGSIIYGYPYGTPCYRYNDRDWDYEKIC